MPSTKKINVKKINFLSDNAVSVHPKIWEMMQEINKGYAVPYGFDETTKTFENLIRKTFDVDCKAFGITNGTSCNALLLASMVNGDEIIFCEHNAHIYNSECNCPEFMTNGARIIGIPCSTGKLTIQDLVPYFNKMNTSASSLHGARPALVSVTQINELGLRYSAHELKALADFCHDNEMKFHVDGSRFANAIVEGNETPAELSHLCGVDALSLGFTKNGAFAAEAAIFFCHKSALGFERRRKRGGQLWSKMRFLSGQMTALLENDLWLSLAKQANSMASQLKEIFIQNGIKVIHPVEGNQVFVTLKPNIVEFLYQNNVLFNMWSKEESCYRFVTAWNTNAETLNIFNKIFLSLKSQ